MMFDFAVNSSTMVNTKHKHSLVSNTAGMKGGRVKLYTKTLLLSKSRYISDKAKDIFGIFVLYIF